MASKKKTKEPKVYGGLIGTAKGGFGGVGKAGKSKRRRRRKKQSGL